MSASTPASDIQSSPDRRAADNDGAIVRDGKRRILPGTRLGSITATSAVLHLS